MRVVRQYGTMWARNEANIAKTPGRKGGRGVYVLFDGSKRMYVGKGNTRSRIKEAGEEAVSGNRVISPSASC
jgi:hypothetical protein